MTEQEKEKQKTTKPEELHKVESKEAQQSENSLKVQETLVDSSNVQEVRKGIVSGSSVQQVRSEIDQMVSAAGVQQARSQIEQPKTQQKEKPQNQK